MSTWRRRVVYYCFMAGVALGTQLVGWSSGTVRAQSEESSMRSALTVSPAIVEKSLTPGEATKFSISVRNITNSPLPIASFARAFTVHSPELEKTSHIRLDASRWFTFDEPEFILQPNQDHIATGIIRPPKDAEPGGHYATVFFQPLVAEEAAHPSMARISARVGVLSFLTVKGDVVEKAILAGPLESPKILRSGPIDITFKIKNTGNVHTMPRGTVEIYDWRGECVESIDIPMGLILPDATKEYTIPWTTPTLFGKYQAQLSLEYGAQHLKLEKATTIFWVMPWPELLAGLLGFVMISFFISKTRGRWKRAWRALRVGSPHK